MRLVALIIVVGSLIMLGRWCSSQHKNARPVATGETGFISESFGVGSQSSKHATVLASNRAQIDDQDAEVLASTPSLPANAKRVQQLSRAVYELPRDAAELLNRFFSLESDSDVETKLLENKNSELVTLEVTADENTQRIVGKFLLTAYPLEKIAKFSEPVEPSENSKANSFASVSGARLVQVRSCVEPNASSPSACGRDAQLGQ